MSKSEDLDSSESNSDNWVRFDNFSKVVKSVSMGIISPTLHHYPKSEDLDSRVKQEYNEFRNKRIDPPDHSFISKFVVLDARKGPNLKIWTPEWSPNFNLNNERTHYDL